MSRPSTLTTIGSPSLSPSPSAIFFSIETSGGPSVIRAPPFAFDDLRALRDLAGIGQAAVALQHPFGIGGSVEVLRLDAARGDDAAAQHRHVLDGRLRRGLLEEFAEAVGVGGGNVDEIKRRRAVRQRRQELPPQIAVDLGDRHQHRQSETQRHHDRRRQRAGPIDVGDRQPQHGDARFAAAAAPAPSRRRRRRAAPRTPRPRRPRTRPRPACHRQARSRPRSAARSRPPSVRDSASADGAIRR